MRNQSEHAERSAEQGRILGSPNLDEMLQEMGNPGAENLPDPNRWVYGVDWAQLERYRRGV
jgi:hypothetical protein